MTSHSSFNKPASSGNNDAEIAQPNLRMSPRLASSEDKAAHKLLATRVSKIAGGAFKPPFRKVTSTNTFKSPRAP